jgi:hypothetical protein
MIARGKAEKKAARTARLSAALRENLKRRKAQARGRSQSAEPNEGADTAPSGESPAGAAKAPDFRRNRGSD